MISSVPSSVTSAWDRASARERRVAIGGAVILVLAVLWAIAWQPLQADIERARAQAARNAEVLQRARALLDEGASLARNARPTAATDPRAAIARVLADHDMQPSGRLELQDGRVKLVLPDARFDRVVVALDALRKDEGLRAVEATLSARVDPGTVRAEITLAR